MNLKNSRSKRGNLLADQASTIYVLFFLVFLPILNCSVLGFRAFFLNFAANHSATRAAKAKTYLKPVEASPGIFTQSSCEVAKIAADEVKKVLPGIDWKQKEDNPDVQIICKPMNPIDGVLQPVKIFSRGHGAPLEGPNFPDQSKNVYLCRVVIRGKVMPLISLPWCDLPGICTPLEVTVSSDALYENISGLTM